jgi:integrase/recombinase XerD
MEFQPEELRERAVPLPEAMIEQLQRLKAERKATAADLVFPNTKGNPDTLHIETRSPAPSLRNNAVISAAV